MTLFACRTAIYFLRRTASRKSRGYWPCNINFRYDRYCTIRIVTSDHYGAVLLKLIHARNGPRVSSCFSIINKIRPWFRIADCMNAEQKVINSNVCNVNIRPVLYAKEQKSRKYFSRKWNKDFIQCFIFIKYYFIRQKEIKYILLFSIGKPCVCFWRYFDKNFLSISLYGKNSLQFVVSEAQWLAR